jgi:hydrogenase maturation protease
MNSLQDKVLILGIGNDILRDDGIGPRLVNDVRKKEFPAGVCFETCALGGLEVLELIRNFNTVIILDAIRTEDGAPGQVYHFKPSDFRETLHLSNLHDVNFLTALELAKKIKITIPDNIHIIAVEILEDMEFGHDLSPELAAKYPEILDQVECYLKETL